MVGICDLQQQTPDILKLSEQFNNMNGPPPNHVSPSPPRWRYGAVFYYVLNSQEAN